MSPSFRLSKLCGLALALLVVGCGGGKNQPLNQDGGAGPVITTTSLPNAIAGADYGASLTANGGHPPLTWSVTSRASGLEWLQVDPATGDLSGVAGVVTSGPVTVQVTDSAALSTSATLTLTVVGCNDGDTTPCTAPQSGACYLGNRTCSGGTFGACAATQDPSTSPSQCGASCGSCGTTGDTCLNGACSCGDAGTTCTDGGTCCSAGCVDTTSDVHACGGCGIDCTQQRQPPNTDAGCASSQCQYPCSSGYLNCDSADAGTGSSSSSDTNGCEINGNTDVSNCGQCGYQCDAHLGSNATGATCSNSSCQVASCTSPYRDCDKSFSNGCETNSSADVNNCGQCGYSCTAHLGSNATGASCSSSACHVTTCTAPYQDCDKSFSNGCEVNVSTDVNNCGTCGHKCGANEVCSSGTCQCAAGYDDCNLNPADGCEVNVAANGGDCCGGTCGCTIDCGCSPCGSSCPPRTVCTTCQADPTSGGYYCQ